MSRLEVLKTYKIYIGGKFPRTESGRYYEAKGAKNKLLANICLSSRKDFRNAVVAARSAQGGWSERTAFNRSQILYRIAEMLEVRSAQFIQEIKDQGATEKMAQKEVELSIDRLVYYAGWCDKYVQVASSVNPVSSSHFNFSTLEPTGVVSVIVPEESSLLGLVSIVAPIIAGGNTVVALASTSKPLCAISFAEVLNSSDVPGGVVNILTGEKAELTSHMASHMDVNAVVYCGSDISLYSAIQEGAVDNVKRTFMYDRYWFKTEAQGLEFITDLQEVKTTWHPIENIGGASSTY